MSVYSVKGKGWRYDFILNTRRYSEAGFKTKTEARQSEAKKREELKNPVQQTEDVKIPIDTAFLDLVNKRLDYVKAYNSKSHYVDHFYMARRWVKHWKRYNSSEITPDMIQDFLYKRVKQISAYAANRDLRTLRAMFNFGMHPSRGLVNKNPTQGIAFFPVEKRIKYVPPKEDVIRVILAADPDTQDYLWAIVLTMARMSEINSLTWQDVDLKQRYVVLYTRKKRGGHLTPRKVPMPQRLFDMLTRRYENRDKRKPWVFWHRYWDKREKSWIDKPYRDRSQIMKYLCKKVDVDYFRFHALRHFGASILDQANVPLGSIQRILGHESRTTTEIYLHSIGDGEKSAMDVLNGKFEDGFSEKVPHHVPHHEKRVYSIVR